MLKAEKAAKAKKAHQLAAAKAADESSVKSVKPPVESDRYVVIDVYEIVPFNEAVNGLAERGYRVVSAWEREAEFDGYLGRCRRAFTALMIRTQL